MSGIFDGLVYEWSRHASKMRSVLVQILDRILDLICGTSIAVKWCGVSDRCLLESHLFALADLRRSFDLYLDAREVFW